MIPLIRGGRQDWAAIVTASGFGLFFLLRIIGRLFSGVLRFTWSKEDAVILAGLAWVCYSLTLGFSPPDAFISFCLILGIAACYFIFRGFTYWEFTALPMAIVFCCLGGVISLVGIAQIMEILPHDWWKPSGFMASTFVNHNHFSAYLELALPLSFAIWCRAPIKAGTRFMIIVFTVLMGVSFILSCSRGAWISLGVSTASVLLIFGLGKKPEGSPWRLALISAIAVSALGYLFSRSMVFDRVMSLLAVPDDVSAQMRISMWLGSLELIQSELWQGYGLQSFIFTFPLYRPEGLYRLINFAHNEYLQTIAEIGLIGMAFLAVFIFFQIRRMAALVRLSKTRWKKSLGVAGLIGFISLCLHSLVDFPWHIPAIAFQSAAVLGVVSGIKYHADPRPLSVRIIRLQPAMQWAARLGGFLLLAGIACLAPAVVTLVRADWQAHQARLLEQKAQYEQSAEYYRMAAEAAPYRSKYYRAWGDVLKLLASQSQGAERIEFMAQASNAYHRVLELVPYDDRTAHDLGILLQAMGHIDGAGKWLQQAVEGDPNNPLYWKDWGEHLHILGDEAGATVAFQRSVSLCRPYDFYLEDFGHLDNPDHFVRIGRRARMSGRLAYAETAYRIAGRLQPAHPEARLGLALTYLNQGKMEEGLTLMKSADDPAGQSRWFAELARFNWRSRNDYEAGEAVKKSLEWDSSNLLAHQIRLLLARQGGFGLGYGKALKDLIHLNRSPVHAGSTGDGDPAVIWEPEEGTYGKGSEVFRGWALYGKGTIRESLALPSGQLKVRVTARGSKAKKIGPIFVLSWEGKEFFRTEVTSEDWQPYEAELIIKPGESLFGISFINDYRNPVTREDRNLKIDNVEVSWEKDNEA